MESKSVNTGFCKGELGSCCEAWLVGDNDWPAETCPSNLGEIEFVGFIERIEREGKLTEPLTTWLSIVSWRENKSSSIE